MLRVKDIVCSERSEISKKYKTENPKLSPRMIVKFSKYPKDVPILGQEYFKCKIK